MTDVQFRPKATTPFPRWSVPIAIASLLAAFFIVLSGQGSVILQTLETTYSDIRTALFSDRLSSDYPDIVIISVGDNGTARRAPLEQRPAIDRGQLAQLVDVIDANVPRAIGFDVPLTGASDTAKDQALQRALREAKARVVIGIRGGVAEGTAERRVWHERFIAGTGRPAGHITMIPDEFGHRVVAVDSLAQAMGPIPDNFALLMARALRPEVRRSFGDIAWLQKIDDGWFARFFNIGAQPPFRTLIANDLAASLRTMPTQLAGRLVLVTTGIAEHDHYRTTPLTLWSGETAAPIQIEAQAIAQLLDGRSVVQLEPRALRLTLFALACLAGLAGWYRGPGWHVGGTALALVLLMVLDATFFAAYGLMLPLVLGLVVWLLGEIAGRHLRGILEWEERHGLGWPIDEPIAGGPSAAEKTRS